MQRRFILATGAALCSPLFLLAQTPATSSPAPSPPTATAPDTARINLEEARKLHESGAVILIDIREPEEHATGIARGAKLLPMSQLNQRWQEIPTDANKPVLLICRTQNRSSSAQAALRKQLGEKYAHVRYVHGGMSEWAQRGWPMVKP